MERVTESSIFRKRENGASVIVGGVYCGIRRQNRFHNGAVVDILYRLIVKTEIETVHLRYLI